MKLIETKGITHLEKFDSCLEWYWGTDYANGDLYEAEETFLMGKQCSPNRLIFVHYPDGTVFEPIKSKRNQYQRLCNGETLRKNSRSTNDHARWAVLDIKINVKME